MSDTDVDLGTYRKAIAATPLFVAYNANVDALVHVDEGAASVLPEPGEVSGDRIETPAGLSAAIAATMAQGKGNQLPVSEEMGDWMAKTLAADERRLGGQAGIAADLAASLGTDPILYTYLLSAQQRAAFSTPNAIRYPFVEDGRVSCRPLGEVTNADRTKTNWIFEFERGATFYGVEACDDTRFIAAARPEAFDLEPGDLADVAGQVGAEVEGAFLAGYQSVKEHFADGSTAVERVESARSFIEDLTAGNDLLVHVEYAATHDPAHRRAIREAIVPEIDALGIDTRELGVLARDADVSTEGEDIFSRYDRACAVREALDVPCLKYHGKEYFVAVMDEYEPAENVRAGFDFASMVAATKATLGTITSPGEVRIGAEQTRSPDGRAAIERLAEELGVEMVDDSIVEPSVVVVPNRVVEDPVSTVGIGDAVSTTSFMLETALQPDS